MNLHRSKQGLKAAAVLADCETWMFPILDIFNEQLGESLLRYRLGTDPERLAQGYRR